MDLYRVSSMQAIVYVNNGVGNFQSLAVTDLVHVHVNHGESDKVCMVSNQVKAYDRVFVAGEAAVQRHLAAQEIGTQIHYPTPPHLSKAYAEAGWKRGDFPLAERLADEVLSLPIGPHVSAEQVDFVCEKIRGFFGAR